jgi:hypothetical protein
MAVMLFAYNVLFVVINWYLGTFKFFNTYSVKSRAPESTLPLLGFYCIASSKVINLHMFIAIHHGWLSKKSFAHHLV